MGSRMYFHILLALSLSALVSCQLQDQSQPQQDVDEYYREDFRLPTNLNPLQHWVDIFTSLQEDDYSFWGVSTIKLEVLADTNQIVLHSYDLSILEEDVSVTQIDGDALRSISDFKIEYNTDYQLLIITINSETLLVGSVYSVRIPFKAPLQDSMYGYVRTCYVDESGNKKCFSVTYFNAGMARRAFPLFDEPAFKPIYTISLGHQEGLTAISNMPIANSIPVQDKQGWVLDVFQDTPKMSGYLVAMIVCEFDFINFEINGIPIKIWVRSEFKNQLKIAQETVSTILPYYNELFGIQYPLPKLDIIAVPNYGSKNQESFGSITMDEFNILYNEDNPLIFDATAVVANVSRMLAYQWFGDLVSMIWWSQVNLIYGLAYFYSERGLATFYDYDLYWYIRLAEIFRSEMNDDSFVALSSALVAPIECADPLCLLQNLNRPKAFLMYRMCNMIVGKEAFLTGLKNYLNNFQYSTASFTDFFNELNYAGIEAQTIPQDFDLATVMKRWIYGKGYPMVKVDVDYVSQKAYLSQVRFIADTRLSTDDRASLEKDCWTVPASYLTSANLDYEDYLAKGYITCDSYLEITLENFTEDMFFLINIRAFGGYRVLYPDQNWQQITNFLLDVNTFEKIDGVIRMQLISDSLEIARPGYLAYSIPHKLVPYLVNETLEHPLKTALYSLRDIRDLLKRTDLRQNFDAYVRSFMQPIFERWNDVTLVPEDLFEARFKLLSDSWSGTYGVEAVLEQSLNILTQWYSTDDPDNNNPMNVNVRETCYCYGVQQGNDDVWYFMYDRFLYGPNDEESSRILFGLGCTKNTDLMKQYLGWALDSNSIDPKWSLTVILSIIYNEQDTSFAVIWEFFTNNYQNISKVLNDDVTQFCPLISLIGGLIDKQDELDQYQAFVNNANLSDCQLEIDSGTRRAQDNISWHSVHDSEWYNLLSPAQTETQSTQN